MERAAAVYLGIKAYGVHINGFTQTQQGEEMWVATRSLKKPTWPGKLDHMVAGGQACPFLNLRVLPVTTPCNARALLSSALQADHARMLHAPSTWEAMTLLGKGSGCCLAGWAKCWVGASRGCSMG